MHLLTMIAFAALFLSLELPRADRMTVPVGAAGALLGWLSIPVLAFVLSRLIRATALRAASAGGDAEHLLSLLHRRMGRVRALSVVQFSAVVLLTPLPSIVLPESAPGIFRGVAALFLLLLPLLAAAVTWSETFPLEARIRQGTGGESDTPPFSRAGFLDFHIRHHVLVVATPLSIVLVASEVIRDFEPRINEALNLDWGPDLVIGVLAAVVFILAPVFLKRIWKTTPLEDGDLRESLLSMCGRLGLRCRDVLVWHSDRMMINAAVMGVLPQVRYIMLSDALLETMSAAQLKAVFGHEAGHVRLRHIPYFLLLAMVGWISVSGGIEGVSALLPPSAEGWGQTVLPGVGGVVAGVCWLAVFGWVSRRFERQADLFGARSVTPKRSGCDRACAVHATTAPGDNLSGGGDQEETATPSRDHVCASAAEVFASALERVAILNGIPHDEPSWRHASIGERIRFLARVAGDPNEAERFERSLRRIKLGITIAAVVALACAWMWWRFVYPSVSPA